MIERLMPKSDEFFDAFDAQAEMTVRGAHLFRALIGAYKARGELSVAEVSIQVQAIKDVEHQGDTITHRAFERLHKQFITPFDRAEIHRLLKRIDDGLDLTDAAAARFAYFEITKPLPDTEALAEVLQGDQAPGE